MSHLNVPLRLSGRDYKRLFDAILDAFNESTLRQCVRFNLDLDLNRITRSTGNLKEKVEDLIDRMERDNRIREFVLALGKGNSGNQPLRIVMGALAGPGASPASDLEKVLREQGVVFKDPAGYRTKMAAAEAQVCRIETGPNEPLGTGFLIGPDHVLTCHHVIAGRPLSLLKFRFDTRVMDDKTVTGRVVVPGMNETDLGMASSVTLDFAVIRLAEKVGTEPLSMSPDAPPRRWQTLKPVDIRISDSLSVLQHPNGSELVFAAGGVTGLHGDFVQYAVDTEPGSSGAPVFNTDWKVVALHRNAGSGAFNTGVRMVRILEALPPRGRRVRVLTTMMQQRPSSIAEIRA